MLPNLRLPGTANDSINDFFAVSSASVARSAATAAAVAAANSSVKTSAAAAAAASLAASGRTFAASVNSGWGQLPPASSSSTSVSFANNLGTSTQRTLADHVKESGGWTQQSNSSSMPWAAAVKAPIEQYNQHPLLHQHSAALAAAASLAAANAFGDSGNSIGSWTSPETSSSTRNGWNADGSMKSDGTPDDGTAIWGNPSTKKTGIDWAEKESLLNLPQANSNSEKRVQKSEPVISSINGTEAWGAPAINTNSTTLNGSIGKLSNSQQLAKLSENSGNNHVNKASKINNEPPSWGESSSLQQTATKTGNSSPTSNSVWNHLSANSDTESTKKPTNDWLSSTSNSSNRLDDMSNQLESAGLFSNDSASLLNKNSSSTPSNNPNLDSGNRQLSSIIGGTNAASAVSANLVSCGIGGANSNSMNDLKQMSANFSTNDLLGSSPNRQSQTNSSSSNNQTQSQLSAYSLGVSPSRELLKQMVHQIQLAVQAGHLNAHILNQPLSTPTLQLVYTLLQQIKLLQQFQDIQQRTQAVNKPNDITNNPTQQNTLDLQINRVQQNISLLQKAITQQQATLTKNESLVESNLKQQQLQASNNSSYNNSYANISKLSTNVKVPSTNIMSDTINSNSNIDSFKRSSLIDTLGNSNSDQSRSEAQPRFEANANLDKNMILQSSASLNNILSHKQQNDFAKVQSYTNNHDTNNQAKANILTSTAQASTSPAAAAWLAFTQGDLSNVQSGTSGGGAWLRSTSGGQAQFNNDLLADLGASKAWRGGPFLSDNRDTSSNAPTSASSSMAPGSNLARPSSASSNLKQMGENNLLNRDQSSFYNWTSMNQTSDSIKRNTEALSSSPQFSSAISGLSLQSNPWLFAPTSNSLNIGSSGLDNLIGNSKIDAKNKTDNGNTDKIRIGNDSIGFLGSNNTSSDNAQRALYDWSDLTSATASIQFNNDNSSARGSKQTVGAGLASSATGSRPGPPPGLLGSLGSLGASPVNEISTILKSDKNNKQNCNNETRNMPSRESTSNLWSGAWYD